MTLICLARKRWGGNYHPRYQECQGTNKLEQPSPGAKKILTTRKLGKDCFLWIIKIIMGKLKRIIPFCLPASSSVLLFSFETCNISHSPKQRLKVVKWKDRNAIEGPSLVQGLEIEKCLQEFFSQRFKKSVFTWHVFVPLDGFLFRFLCTIPDRQISTNC